MKFPIQEHYSIGPFFKIIPHSVVSWNSSLVFADLHSYAYVVDREQISPVLLQAPLKHQRTAEWILHMGLGKSTRTPARTAVAATSKTRNVSGVRLLNAPAPDPATPSRCSLVARGWARSVRPHKLVAVSISIFTTKCFFGMANLFLFFFAATL